MALTPEGGRWVMEKMPKKANTTYTAGMGIYNDNTDNVPTTSTTQGNFKGILVNSYSSADATTDPLYVLKPAGLDSTFRASVNGTLTAAMVGDQFDWHTDGLSVAQGASTYDAVECVKYISATEGVFRANITLGIEN